MVMSAERRALLEPRNYVRRDAPLDLGVLMARLRLKIPLRPADVGFEGSVLGRAFDGHR